MMSRNHGIEWRWLAPVMLIGLLTGCSGQFTYPNTFDKNLRIHTTTDSGSVFSSVRAAVGIYRVDAGCKIEYQGTLDLDDQEMSVGIPSGRPTYLVFEFANNSFLANSRRSITYDTLLNPAHGRRYDVEVSYHDDIYNVAIRETRPGDTMARDVERRDLRTCSTV